MSIYNSDETIIACSTGNLSNTAIAVIRISGNDYLNSINQFFDLDINKIKPRQAYFCKIVDEALILDEIVLTFFKGPNSYNGDDIIELSVHGNQINIRRIIKLFIDKAGFRHSEPGEFTFRSMKNNKLSLTQVEGLDLLLNASSIFSLDQGYSLLSGKLQEGFRGLYDSLLKHKSSLEFGFDFLEDMGEERFNLEFNDSFRELQSNIKKLHSHVSNQGFNLIKPEVTIFGLPNAGKSSLFNLLLDEDRAITSNIAGTTRDFIREDISINNNIFTLIDTAGIRLSDDLIEAKGIEKALEVVDKSFFKILLVNPYEFDETYYSKVKEVQFDSLIFTHSDREGFNELAKAVCTKLIGILGKEIGPIEPIKPGPIEPTKSGPIEPIKSGPIEPTKSGPIEPTKSGPIEPTKSGPIEPIKSCPIEPTKSGPIEPIKSGPIEPISLSLIVDTVNIKEEIFKLIELKYLKLLTFDPVLIERHAESIRSVYNLFLDYEKAVNSTDDLAIIASELNIVGHCVSELIGIISPDDVLHNIFDKFCIGK
ncbi:MAG: tRNA modification GTPase [Bacteriovoracaceae bacterium]|jgi:tRNA modification GTPase